MQTTQSLILQYGRTQHGVGTLAHRLRKRLRRRARNRAKYIGVENTLAQKFLGASFKPQKNIARIRTDLLLWFKRNA